MTRKRKIKLTAIQRLRDYKSNLETLKTLKDITGNCNMGKYLRQVRGNAGLTLKEMQEITGHSVVYLSDVERNNRRATLHIVTQYMNL